MKICFLFSERKRGEKERGKERKESEKKTEGKVVLLPSKLWMGRPSLDTAAKG